MSKAIANPFFEIDFSKLMDSSKMMAGFGASGFKMPGFDMNVLMEIQHKNIEMITVINQAIAESLQSFAHRHAELVQQSFEEANNLMHAMMAAPTPQEKVGHHVEASKTVVEKYMAHTRDAAETLAKCNSHAMETVRNRMSEGVAEFNGLIKTNAVA